MNMEWKCHTPNLLNEILSNNGTGALQKPLNIFGKLLAEVAERAAKIDDPELNLLMLRLTLYDQGDADKHSTKDINAAYQSQRDRLAA